MGTKPKCSVTDCTSKPVYTVAPMSGITGNWEVDEPGKPTCASHLRATLWWMSEHHDNWHVSSRIDLQVSSA